MTTLPRLSEKTLSELKAPVRLPQYDRTKVAIGIVHFGPGAFHRGHQACYIDTLLAHDSRWGLCGAELRGSGLRDALAPQDNLYVVAELDAEPHFRVIGSLLEYFTAEHTPNAIFARLIATETKLVTMTVTEKGYCLDNAGALDFSNPDIRHDLERPDTPRSLIGWLARSLKARKEAKIRPFVVLSCDNVSGNGRKLRRATLDFASALYGRELGAWINEEVRFPSTMVDSITPATTDELKQRVGIAVGLTDEAPVHRESFQQWVVEDSLGDDAPDLAAAGAILTNDVEAYESAKLRLLNAAHSTLAYAGLLLGYTSVGAAMHDRALSNLVERMMREDIAPTLRRPAGLDFDQYITAILNRFRNSALTHLLLQIASDGSQKLPIRVLTTISELLKLGRPIGAMAVPVAAWMLFIVNESKNGRRLADPLAEPLSAVAASCTGDAYHDTAVFLGLHEVFPTSLAGRILFRKAVTDAYAAVSSGRFG